jgi:shikimate kinase
MGPARLEHARHAVIVGLMGAGKTTLGTLLAARLRWPLWDSDAEILVREGTTVRVLQERRGAGALHAIEAEVLLAALARPQRSVICAAASSVDDARCREALREPTVVTVCLLASLDTLVARYDSDPHRPRYAQGTRAALAEQQRARAAHFAAVADVTVAVDGRSAAQVLECVLSAAGGEG